VFLPDIRRQQRHLGREDRTVGCHMSHNSLNPDKQAPIKIILFAAFASDQLPLLHLLMLGGAEMSI
jgi:hypothetical protein